MAAAIRFLLDEHVPLAIAEGLRRRGVDAVHVSEADLQTTSDADLREYALREGRVVVTNDPDFLAFQRDEISHAGIAYYPTQDRSIGDMVRALVLIHGVLCPEEMRQHVEFL